MIARAGNGSVTLTMPAGSGPYDVAATTGNGAKHVVPIATGAKSSITAHTGNGRLTIGESAD